MKPNDFEFVKLKDSNWFERQKVAGKITARCLNLARGMILNHNDLSLKEIEKACVDVMIKNDCTPTFLNYKGFPGAICASVNQQLVHGIPSDYKIKDGDVVKIDLGVTYKDAVGDSAFTVIKGQAKHKDHIELIKVTEECLNKGIEAVKIGNRVGSIGNAIYRHSRNYKFGLITNYGGHGIQSGAKPHSSPFIHNKSTINDGVHIQNGLTIAIEPMLVMGEPTTRVLSDKWTVITPGIGSHFEHTIMIYENKIHIMTLDDN